MLDNMFPFPLKLKLVGPVNTIAPPLVFSAHVTFDMDVDQEAEQSMVYALIRLAHATIIKT